MCYMYYKSMKKRDTKAKKKVYGKTLSALIASGVIAGGLLWFGVRGGTHIPVPLYTVSRVFDGDTLETAEKQYIRLSGIDAPEMGRCGSTEAKQELERLVMKKPVYIKILYHLGSRQTGLIYTIHGSVNTAMLASGWAVKYDRDTPNDPAMQKATDEARAGRRGIFSALCTQPTNPTRPDCAIKGNNPYRDGTKTYHTPNCPGYTFTKVELYKGDQWFCTEKEAKQAGYTKAKGC